MGKIKINIFFHFPGIEHGSRRKRTGRSSRTKSLPKDELTLKVAYQESISAVNISGHFFCISSLTPQFRGSMNNTSTCLKKNYKYKSLEKNKYFKKLFNFSYLFDFYFFHPLTTATDEWRRFLEGFKLLYKIWPPKWFFKTTKHNLEICKHSSFFLIIDKTVF